MCLILMHNVEIQMLRTVRTTSEGTRYVFSEADVELAHSGSSSESERATKAQSTKAKTKKKGKGDCILQ